VSTATAPDRTPTNRLELSRAQAWVVHHVVLEHLLEGDRDGDQPWWALDAVRTLEAGEAEFTAFQAWRLRCALLDHAADPETPDPDVTHARAVADRIERTFDGPPTAIC